MNVKYANRVIDKLTHGKSTSAYIKTYRGDAVTPPIGCVPIGKLNFNLYAISEPVMMSAQSTIQSDNFIQVAVNGSQPRKVYFNDPRELMEYVLSGFSSNQSNSVPGIDPRTVMTDLVVSYMSMRFMLNVVMLEYIINAGGGSNESIALAQEFYKDVYGEELDMNGPMTTLLLTGMSTGGTFKGATKDWSIVDLVRDRLEVTGVDLTVEDVETSVTYYRSGQPGDQYNSIFLDTEADQLTVSSCTSVSTTAPTFTCVPTVKTFTPTAELEMNDGYGAYLMRIRFDLTNTIYTESGPRIENEVVYVDRVVTTNPEDSNFYNDDDTWVDMYVIEDTATPYDIACGLFNIIGSPMIMANPVNNIGGIGISNSYCNLLASYDATENEITLAGMFDEFATDPQPEYVGFYEHIYSEVRYAYANKSVAKITLEPATGPNNLPYYGKCYVTEQFGGPIVLQSCLSLVLDQPA